jgi:hypothetical protein
MRSTVEESKRPISLPHRAWVSLGPSRDAPPRSEDESYQKNRLAEVSAMIFDIDEPPNFELKPWMGGEVLRSFHLKPQHFGWFEEVLFAASIALYEKGACNWKRFNGVGFS